MSFMLTYFRWVVGIKFADKSQITQLKEILRRASICIETKPYKYS